MRSFFWRWWWRLPSPFSSEDFEAGYTYELAFRQFEVSETCVFDRPQAGRMWFEGVIRDHLDIGRPEQVALIFDRRVTRRTPGSFRSRVLRRGVDPVLSCYYKSSRIKQYFKDGRADVLTFQEVSQPSKTAEGLHSSGLRFGDPRVMAVFSSLVAFSCLVAGFDNRRLVEQVSALLDAPYTSRQASYDLRRLRRKGLIDEVPRKRQYHLTPLGRKVAVLFIKAYGRVLAPGLTALDPKLPQEVAQRCPLATAWRRFDRSLNVFVEEQLLAA